MKTILISILVLLLFSFSTQAQNTEAEVSSQKLEPNPAVINESNSIEMDEEVFIKEIPSRAKAIAEEFLATQYYKDAFEPRACSVMEFQDYVEVQFRRKILIPEKGKGVVWVDKRTAQPKWIPCE